MAFSRANKIPWPKKMPALQARTNQDLKVCSVQYFFFKRAGLANSSGMIAVTTYSIFRYGKILAGKLNKPKAYFYSRKCIFYFLLILVQGFSLVENFDSTRLCGSAVSHARL